jgi:hypothetical protein
MAYATNYYCHKKCGKLENLKKMEIEKRSKA